MSPSKQAGASFLFGDRIDPEWNGAALKEIGPSGGFQRNELVLDFYALHVDQHAPCGLHDET